MKPMTVRERINGTEILVSDGATGTNLQARGLKPGQPAEVWLLERPEEIIRLHQDFIKSGSDILLTNTFGCNSVRLSQFGLSDKVDELNQRAVQLARKAIDDRPVILAGSIGPTGHMLKPLGDLEEDIAVNAFTQQARVLVDAGVEMLVVETQYDLVEAEIAVRAAQSVAGNLPIVCSFSYDRGIRTMMGVKPVQMARHIEALQVDMLGVNCGKSIEENLNVLKEIKANTKLPVWFKPNAGLPQLDEVGKAIYDVTPEIMGQHAVEWVEAGAKVVGGCCGTSPEHLKQIALSVKKP